MPGIDFRQLRASIGMAEVLALIGFVPRSSAGAQRRGGCPLHGSEAPTSRVFSVNLARHSFQCFKCGQAGNQLDLWAAFTKQPLYEAAIDLCQRLNYTIPWLAPEQRRGTRTRQ